MARILAKIAGHIIAIPIGIIEIFAPYSFEGEYKKFANGAAEDFSHAFNKHDSEDDFQKEIDAKNKSTTYWQKQYKKNKENNS